MEFKLTSDISQSVLCPESFVAFELLNIKLYIKVENEFTSPDNTEFIKKHEEILYDKIMIELGDLVKNQIKYCHPYGQILKVPVKKTVFEKIKSFFKHEKGINVTRD